LYFGQQSREVRASQTVFSQVTPALRPRTKPLAR
jgi:hypothetical protein